MLKKNITYEDFNGKTRSEDFYFNLSEAELAELQMSTAGGLGEFIKRIVNEDDGAEIIGLFKQLVQMSIGKKSDDGRRFMKSPEIVRDFMETNAYTVLFMELATDADKATAFMNGIVPQESVISE